MSVPPWSKLYHATYAADLRLRGAKLEERGLFWSLYLAVHQGLGAIVGFDDAASLAAVSRSDLERLLPRLVSRGLVEVAGDEIKLPDLAFALRLSSVRSKAGREGGNASHDARKGMFASDKLPEANSSSSSLSSRGKESPRGKGAKFDAAALLASELPGLAGRPEVAGAWGEWVAHRAETRKPMTVRAARIQLRAAVGWGPERFVAAVMHSIASGYQGLFEPKGAVAPQKPSGINGAEMTRGQREHLEHLRVLRGETA